MILGPDRTLKPALLPASKFGGEVQLLMSKMTKVRLDLTQEMNDIVEQAVASGAYATTSEVIGEALRQWRHHRALELEEPEDLRRLWAEGLESGPGRFDGIDGIRQEARRKQTAGTAPYAGNLC